MATTSGANGVGPSVSWRDTYEQLAGLGDRADADERERLAVAAHLIGAEDWVDRWTDACSAHDEGGMPDRAARCAFWVAYGLLTSGRFAQGGGWLERAHELLAQAPGDCAERGLLLVPGAIAVCDDDPGAALGLFTDALAIGRRHEDHDLVAIALMGQGQAQVDLNEIADALGALDSAMFVVTTEAVHPIAEGIVYCGVIDACRRALELRRALEWTAVLSRWCDTQPDIVPFRGQCLVHRAEVMQLRGNWQDALEESQKARLQLDGTPLAGEAAYREGEVHRLLGEQTAAEVCFVAAAEAGRDPQPGLSLLRLASGDVPAALKLIRRATSEPSAPSVRLMNLVAAVEVYLAAGDIVSASAATDEAGAIASMLDVPFARGASLHAAGHLRLIQGDSPAALASLRAAWRIWRDVATPYEAARTRLLLGLACRAAGDDETAAMQLDAARLAFSNLGAGPDLAQAEAAAAGAEEAPALGLSVRERQVLALVADGRTNREIAAELIVSEHTVARHVQNIFTKLGVNTRTAAAALAHRHGLA